MTAEDRRALGEVLYESDRQQRKRREKDRQQWLSTYLLAPARLAPPHVLSASACIGAVAFFFYFVTLAPYVTGGDSGELAVAAHQWSIAHPPGYPLFTVLGYICDHGLPLIGIEGYSAAWRIALLSAASDALAAAFLCAAVCLWTGETWAGMLSGGLFAFSKQVWLYATQVEVFPLNNLFVALLLLLLTVLARKYHLEADTVLIKELLLEGSAFRLQLVGLAVVGGLALLNQHTAVIFVFPLLLWAAASPALVLATSKANAKGKKKAVSKEEDAVRTLTIRLLVVMAFCGFVTLALGYGLMWWRHCAIVTNMPYSWGDIRSIGGFLKHLLRQEYGTLRLYSGTGEAPSLTKKLIVYFWSMQRDTMYLGAPLGAVGVYAMVGRGWQSAGKTYGVAAELFRRAGVALLAVFVLYVVGFFYLCNLPISQALHLGVFERFFPQANLLVLFAVGVGAAFVKFRLAPHYRGSVLLVVVVLLLAANVQMNYEEMDQSRDVYIRNYAEQVLAPLPANSLLLVKGDLLTNPVAYLQRCEGFREDVTVLSMEQMTYEWFVETQGPVYPKVTFPGLKYRPYTEGMYSMHDFLMANYYTFPIHYAGGWKPGDYSPQHKFAEIPYGLTVKLVLKEEDWSLESGMEVMEMGMPAANMPLPPAKYGPDSWERVVESDYWHTYHMKALYMLNYVLENGETMSSARSQQVLTDVVNIYESVLERCMYPRSHLYLNLGIAYESLRKYHGGQVGKDMATRMLEVWSEYLLIADVHEGSYRAVKNNVNAWRDFLENEATQDAKRARSYAGSA